MLNLCLNGQNLPTIGRKSEVLRWMRNGSCRMLSEVVRFFYQYKTFYCYLVPVVWIVLLLAGMYKYTTRESIEIPETILKKENFISEYPQFLEPESEFRSFRYCNLPNDIKLGNEGNLEGNLTLEGILILTRNGDRGPLSHIKDINKINCAGDVSTNPEIQSVYKNYLNFLQNVTLYSRAAWSQFLGPFHGFPVLPVDSKVCELAQLTNVGIGQLLKTGLLLRQAYFRKLNFDNSSLAYKDVLVYSTRYRRTVQSAVAFLYAFFENESLDKLVKISFKESQSHSFCFSDCACPAAEKYHKIHLKEIQNQLKRFSKLTSNIQKISNTIFENPEVDSSKDLRTVQDALLTYLCHNATVPCPEYNFLNPKSCIKSDQIESLFAYSEWNSKQKKLNMIHKKYGILRAYGLLRNIVSQMLHIISEGKPKLVFYSVHSKTLEYLAIALDIFFDYTTSLLYYASRLIVEIYKSGKSQAHEASDFYFRILINGKDVTSKIPFCRNNRKEINNASLCPIESIIRLLHDDYFTMFNATNFKDACTIHERKP